MATQLNIIQWNAQSAKAKRANLERLITDYNADIILICETWYKRSDVINLKNFVIYRDDREDGHGGTAIFVNKVINAKPLSFTSRPKNVNISGIYLPQINVSIVCVYRPVHASMSCQDYNGLLNQIKTPFILGGDFNAHHSAMGSSKTDNDGNLLLKTIDNHQLVFLNDGSPTKLSRPNQCVSAIDVSLVSSSIAHYFDWEVVDDTYSSDHFPIKIVMGLRSSDIGTMFPRTRWKVEAGNLPLFTEYCNRFFPEDTQYLTAGEKLTLLFSFLTQAGDLLQKKSTLYIAQKAFSSLVG